MRFTKKKERKEVFFFGFDLKRKKMQRPGQFPVRISNHADEYGPGFGMTHPEPFPQPGRIYTPRTPHYATRQWALHDTVFYHIILWFFVLGALAVGIVGIFFPKATTVATATAPQMPPPVVYEPRQVAFRGGEGNIYVKQKEEYLRLFVLYDIENGKTAKNYDGRFFVAPTTGIYSLAVEMSLSFTTRSSESAHFEIAIEQVNATGDIVDVISDWFAVSAYHTNKPFGLRLTGDMVIRQKNKLRLILTAYNTDKSIYIDRVWFTGHLISDKVPTLNLNEKYRALLTEKYSHKVEVVVPRDTLPSPKKEPRDKFDDYFEEDFEEGEIEEKEEKRKK